MDAQSSNPHLTAKLLEVIFGTTLSGQVSFLISSLLYIER